MPEWIKESIREQPEEELEAAGFGKRRRGEVSYKEQLTESQWLKAIEEGKDPKEEIERRKKAGLPLGEDLPEDLEFDLEDEEPVLQSGDEFELGEKRQRKK